MYIVHYVDDDILQARLAFSMRKYSIEPSNDLLSEGRGEPCATSHRDPGGAGLVPGPAGDHSDSPQRLRHGLQQGRRKDDKKCRLYTERLCHVYFLLTHA